MKKFNAIMAKQAVNDYQKTCNNKYDNPNRIARCINDMYYLIERAAKQGERHIEFGALTPYQKEYFKNEFKNAGYKVKAHTNKMRGKYDSKFIIIVKW